MRKPSASLFLLMAFMLIHPSMGAGAIQLIDGKPPLIPTGYDLFKLSPRELQAYVSGIYEGQLLMAEFSKIPPLICVDDMLTRDNFTSRFLNNLRAQTDMIMRLPARIVVMAILIMQHPCDQKL